MFNYNKINIITGWVVFFIALVVYVLTVEPTASYWDCGEFIAVSYKLEVPHPPGAPLFLLIGRLFSFLAMGDESRVAFWINMVSVLSSAFTILFMFWSITHIGKRLLGIKDGDEDVNSTIPLMAAGIVGSLAYTFSDSFWFSAVEAEVYAMSSFFTAIVFWAILKWENIDDEGAANRWLILIAYIMGLSIGIHLLNLVAIPALGLIYYFKKNETVTAKGIIKVMVVCFVMILGVLNGVIPGLPSLAGSFELFFVNSLGLPFNSGIIFFGIVFVAAVVAAIIFSEKKKIQWLNTAVLGVTFLLIGYLSYAVIVIRSNFDPPIDENDPEDVVSFVSYLKREQYGDRPLFKGQYYTG